MDNSDSQPRHSIESINSQSELKKIKEFTSSDRFLFSFFHLRNIPFTVVRNPKRPTKAKFICADTAEVRRLISEYTSDAPVGIQYFFRFRR